MNRSEQSWRSGDVFLRGTSLGDGPLVLFLHAGRERRQAWDPAIDDPVAEALTPTLTSSRRVAAVRATPPEQALELMPLVLSSRHPIAVRQEAVEAFAEEAQTLFEDALEAAKDIGNKLLTELLKKVVSEIERRLGRPLTKPSFDKAEALCAGVTVNDDAASRITVLGG